MCQRTSASKIKVRDYMRKMTMTMITRMMMMVTAMVSAKRMKEGFQAVRSKLLGRVFISGEIKEEAEFLNVNFWHCICSRPLESVII